MDERTKYPPTEPEGRLAARPAWGRRRTLVLGAALLVLVAAIGWLLTPGADRSGGNGRFGSAGPSPVGVATVVRGDMALMRDALGTVTPLATVTVRTQVSGRLERMPFQEGETVRAGQLLAEIDPRPYEANLQVALGALERDRALLANAETDAKRYETLYRQDSVAEQTLAAAIAQVKQYRGTVAADEGQVAAARVNLSYCRIASPVTGRVGLRQVDPGNYVTPGDANGLVVVTQTKPITVVFTLPEEVVPDLLRRLRGGAKLPVSAYDRDRNEAIARGTLAALDSQIDTATGTIRLKANFANDDDRLFPNQFVNVELELDTLRDTLLVPQAAVQRGAPGAFVYVVNEAGDAVTVRPIEAGPANATQVAIAKGLKPGERVVVDGVDRLRDGAKIAIGGGRDSSQPTAPAEHRRQRRN